MVAAAFGKVISSNITFLIKDKVYKEINVTVTPTLLIADLHSYLCVRLLSLKLMVCVFVNSRFLHELASQWLFFSGFLQLDMIYLQ